VFSAATGIIGTIGIVRDMEIMRNIRLVWIMGNIREIWIMGKAGKRETSGTVRPVNPAGACYDRRA